MTSASGHDTGDVQEQQASKGVLEANASDPYQLMRDLRTQRDSLYQVLDELVWQDFKSLDRFIIGDGVGICIRTFSIPSAIFLADHGIANVDSITHTPCEISASARSRKRWDGLFLFIWGLKRIICRFHRF